MYKQGLKLIDIANQLGVAEGTVRSWKNRYKWNGETNATLQKNKRNVAKENKQTKKVKKESVADEVEAVIQNADLTDKQQLFCIYYIRCFNATKAYQKAYDVDYATAVVNGPRLLGNARIKDEIFRLKQERLNREFLSESDIFQKYMDIAFADVTDFVEFGNEDVDVILDTGERKTITVSHVNIKNDADVDGTIISEVSKGKDGVKVKLADRMKALQWLSDHMDLATEKQKAEIALLKAKVQTDDGDEVADDGFLEALNGTAAEDWGDEENQ
jgi:phage terminase small subunit|nr:MAG TPA: Terminase small subunit [Caudoviricetes sp.]DAI71258.1 MAG TPA: Terminase small subunit [Caudoviricetes sp.]